MTTKLALGLALLLLLLTLGGFAVTAVAVNAPRDAVAVTATTLAGDVSAAEGLDVRLRTTLEHHLFWNIAYRPGNTPTAETEYDFTALERRESGERSLSGVTLSTTLSAGYGFSRNGIDGIDSAEQERGLIAAYNALYRETKNGEERSKVILLSDYYDYYPITGSIDLPGYRFEIEWEDAHQNAEPPKNSHLYVAWRLQEYFKIPIVEGQTLEISISKSADGHSIGVGSHSGTGVSKVGYYYGGVHSVLTDDACYFILDARTTEGGVIDVSRIEGGYGIYCLPFMEKPEDIDCLSMVYPLDPTLKICGLEVSENKEKLLLFINRNGTATLTVIDIATMTEVQVLTLGIFPHESDVWSRHDVGDLHLMTLGYSRFLLVEPDEEGKYVVRLDLDVAQYDDSLRNSLQYMFPSQVIAWDGERLAIADYWMRSGSSVGEKEICSFYLAVLGEDGLAYFGTYDTSLNTATDEYTYTLNCRPMDIDPITISWGKE